MVWIRIDEDFPDHPKLVLLESFLEPFNEDFDTPSKADAIEVIFRLFKLAMKVDPVHGELTKYRNQIEKLICGSRVFGPSVSVLVDVGFIDRKSDGRIFVHDWWEVNGKHVQKLITDRDRKRAARSEDGPNIFPGKRGVNSTDSPGRGGVNDTVRNGTYTETENGDKDVTTTEDDEASLLDEKKGDSKGGEARAIAEYAVKRWNELGIIPSVRSLTPARISTIGGRYREHGEPAVYEVVEKRAKSNFLSNVFNDGRGAAFDWVFGPKNFPKVIDGNYDDDRIGSSKPVPSSHAGAHDAGNGEWVTETYRREDLNTWGNHSMWDEYLEAAMDMPPKSAPTFEDWLAKETGDIT